MILLFEWLLKVNCFSVKKNSYTNPYMLALEEEGRSTLPNAQPFSPEAEHLEQHKGVQLLTLAVWDQR